MAKALRLGRQHPMPPSPPHSAPNTGLHGVTLSATRVITNQLQTLQDCSRISKKLRELRVQARPHHNEAQSLVALAAQDLCPWPDHGPLLCSLLSNDSNTENSSQQVTEGPKGTTFPSWTFHTFSTMLTLRSSTDPLTFYLTK